MGLGAEGGARSVAPRAWDEASGASRAASASAGERRWHGTMPWGPREAEAVLRAGLMGSAPVAKPSGVVVAEFSELGAAWRGAQDSGFRVQGQGSWARRQAGKETRDQAPLETTPAEEAGDGHS